jgi:hypothetical protein
VRVADFSSFIFYKDQSKEFCLEEYPAKKAARSNRFEDYQAVQEARKQWAEKKRVEIKIVLRNQIRNAYKIAQYLAINSKAQKKAFKNHQETETHFV